jgi:hypothetical protein
MARRQLLCSDLPLCANVFCICIASKHTVRTSLSSAAHSKYNLCTKCFVLAVLLLLLSLLLSCYCRSVAVKGGAHVVGPGEFGASHQQFDLLNGDAASSSKVHTQLNMSVYKYSCVARAVSVCSERETNYGMHLCAEIAWTCLEQAWRAS